MIFFKKNALLLFLSSVLVSLQAHSQVLTKENVKNLIDSLSRQSLNEQTMKSFQVVEKQAKKINYKRGEIQALLGQGNFEFEKGNLEQAFVYYQKGFKEAEQLGDTALLAKSYVSLGYVKSESGESDNAMTFFQQGMDLVKEIGDTNLIAETLTAQGIVYAKKEQYDEAIEKFEEGKSIKLAAKDSAWVQNSLYNIAYLYSDSGQPEKALPIALDYLKFVKSDADTTSIAFAYNLIARSMIDTNREKEALLYLDSALTTATYYKLAGVLPKVNENYSIAYEKIGDDKNALSFYKKYHEESIEYVNVSSKKNIAELELQYETERKEKELLDSQNQVAALEIEQQRMWLLIVSLIAILAIVLSIYFKLKSNAQKKRIEQKLIVSELKNKELETEQLQVKLSSKQSDITNLALDIARKNKFSTLLIKKLELLKKVKPQDFKTELRQTLSFATNNLQISKDLSLLQKNVSTINREFYQKLEGRLGKLTANEKYLVGLIRLNLSNKDVAAIRGISTSSAKMSRHRLRKKLGLDSNVDIVRFLQEV
ncbi:MAG: hypothetical protein ACPG49_10490 [Chitinophagales bacterium]